MLRRAGLLFFAVSTLLIAPAAQALKFKLLREGQILLIYDCPLLEKGACLPHENGFEAEGSFTSENGEPYSYPGDAAIYRRLLNQRKLPWRQVWLFSGGGNLNEGLELGKLFREQNEYVLVLKETICASACTLAFLGGRLRDVEPDGNYMVHAYSAVSTLDREQLAHTFQGKNSQEELAEFILRQSKDGRAWAVRLLAYVQIMIGGVPQTTTATEVLAQSLPYHQHYLAGDKLEADLTALRQEGPSRIQEILMRIERDAFEHALSILQQHTEQLGPRADHALDMLHIMFSSSIRGTFALDQTTLREKGYINVRR